MGNLEHLCRSDHTFKHDTRWRLEQLPHGNLRWTSPIGQVIVDEPEPAGPVFTDMPRTPPRQPKLTRAERRRQQQELTERMMADTRRILAGEPLDLDPDPPPGASMTGWGTEPADAGAAPTAF